MSASSLLPERKKVMCALSLSAGHELSPKHRERRYSSPSSSTELAAIGFSSVQTTKTPGTRQTWDESRTEMPELVCPMVPFYLPENLTERPPSLNIPLREQTASIMALGLHFLGWVQHGGWRGRDLKPYKF